MRVILKWLIIIVLLSSVAIALYTQQAYDNIILDTTTYTQQTYDNITLGITEGVVTSCTCSGAANCAINCADNCRIPVTNANMYNITATGTGTIYGISNMSNYSNFMIYCNATW